MITFKQSCDCFRNLTRIIDCNIWTTTKLSWNNNIFVLFGVFIYFFYLYLNKNTSEIVIEICRISRQKSLGGIISVRKKSPPH